jgi:hypothetical protein
LAIDLHLTIWAVFFGIDLLFDDDDDDDDDDDAEEVEEEGR